MISPAFRSGGSFSKRARVPKPVCFLRPSLPTEQKPLYGRTAAGAPNLKTASRGVAATFYEFVP